MFMLGSVVLDGLVEEAASPKDVGELVREIWGTELMPGSVSSGVSVDERFVVERERLCRREAGRELVWW